MAERRPGPKIAPQQRVPQAKQPALVRPTPTYEVMITALPNGRQDGSLKLSIVLSPRLKVQGNATLALFKPLFTTDWPNFIKSLKFDVYFDSPTGPVKFPAQGEWEFAPAPNNTPPFDANLWAGVFRDNMLVRGYTFDAKKFTDDKKFKFHTFPEKSLITSIKTDLYQPIALEAPIHLPSNKIILDLLQKNMNMVVPDARLPGGLRVGVKNPVLELNRVRGDVLKKFPGAGRVIPRGLGKRSRGQQLAAPKFSEQQLKAVQITKKQYDLLQFQAFHHIRRRPKEQPIPPRPSPPQYDFHQIVGSLFEYPELARRLGLCLDLRLKLDPRIPADGKVWVRPAIADATLANQFISPKTCYVLGGVTGFMSKPEDENLQLQDGMLKFGAKLRGVPVYDVVPGDVDGFVRRVEVYSTKLVSRLASALRSVKPVVQPRAVPKPGQLQPTKPGLQAPTVQHTLQLRLAESTTLPAARSSGLSVAHDKRDEFLNDLLAQSKSNSDLLDGDRGGPGPRGTNVCLNADDLIRGYRIDVREVRGSSAGRPVFTPWRSLNFRHGSYHLLGPIPPPPGSPLPPPVLVYDEEGWISLGVTREDESPSAEGESSLPKQLHVYQSLFRWDGWSLSVPRPGKHLGIDDQPSHGQGGRLPGASTMQVLFSPVPGTLPRLRFGRQYQFRARVVDLAGNSLSVDVPAPRPEFATDVNDGFYDRMEPVPTPTVLLTAPLAGKPTQASPDGEPLSPGESVDRVVIRTMNLEFPGNPVEGLAAGPPPGPSGRHLLPPKISQELAEQHGMFDDPNTHLMRGDEAYNVMIAKDGNVSDLIPPDRRAMIRKEGGEFFPEPSLAVPYLPDPMAAGVTCLIYRPGADPKSVPAVQVPFPVQGGWPNAGSFRVQLEPGSAPPSVNGPSLLRVFVPPGEERILRASCYLLSEHDTKFGQPNRETLFGIWRWMEERAAPKDREPLRRLVQSGRHWMLTPFHELVLVHATQQPVLTPQWVCIEELPEALYGQASAPDCTVNTLQPNHARHRRLGETTATIDATIAIHRPSTEELDLQADWLEPVDDPDKPMASENLNEWLYVKGLASPFEVKISYVPSPTRGPVVARGVPSEGGEPEGEPEPVPGGPTEILPDAQELPVRPEVQPRDMPEKSSEVPDGPESAEGPVQERGVSRFGVRPQAQSGIQRPVPPVVARPQPPKPPAYDESPHRCAPTAPPPPPPDYGQRFRFQGLHRFGDTRYRCVSYTAIATSRYREYFRPMPDEEVALLKQGKVPPRWTRTSPAIKLDILSSAQPVKPEVLYIIPTFQWENTPQGHRRVGGGLRVYLNRPWYSSGDGEQLAVVLYPDAKAELPEYAKPHVTQWGLDPLWESGPPSQVIRPELPRQPITPQFRQPGRVLPREVPEEEVTPRALAPAQQSTVRQVDPKLLALFRVGVTHPTPSHFRNAVAVRHDLGVREAPLPSGPIGTRAVPPSKLRFASQLFRGTPMPVTICAFEVKPDAARQLWYCDIEMDPGTAYFPFVRLALARYQVNSIPGAHLSPVVLADFAQLVPDRTASVVINPTDPNQVTVTVAGVQGTAGSPRTTVVEIEVEEFNPSVPGELGWTPIPNAKPVSLPRVSPQQWTGQLTLPPPGSKEHRVVVKEYEVFQMAGEADTARSQERRLVYADALPITR